jgi:hypothetical protein
MTMRGATEEMRMGSGRKKKQMRAKTTIKKRQAGNPATKLKLLVLRSISAQWVLLIR